MTLFVDTSAFYAVADEGDRHHGRAGELLAAGESLSTTDHVLIESWGLIGRRLGQAAADLFWTGLRGGAVRLEGVGAADLEAAWHIGQNFPDQGFSIVDRTSFAVMERLGISRVAAFDHHFAVYRYGPKRDRAFEIVR